MKKNSKKKNNNDEWKGCDNCAICKAMKNGDANSLEGLKDAFRKAEEGGAHVGGSFLQNFQMAMKTADKDDLYYDAMDLLDQGPKGAKEAEKLLQQAFSMDKNYVQTHIGFVYIY